MEQKVKFAIIGLAGVCVVFIFLLVQGFNTQQMLTRERNDLKSENTTLSSKISQLEVDLKSNRNKIELLQGERDKAVGSLSELQLKLDTAIRSRDELTAKLKKQSQNQGNQGEVISKPVEVTPVSSDAYWGGILKAKTDLELKLSAVRVQLRELQINNDSLEREKVSLESDLKRVYNEKQDLLKQMDYNQKLMDSITQEVVRERNDKVRIQESAKVISGENEILNKQLKGLNNRKLSLDKKIQELQVGKETVEKRLTEMESMLTDRISQVDSLKNELDGIRSGKVVTVEEKRSRESVELPEIVVRSSVENNRSESGEFSGKILAVNPDSNFVVVDLGTSFGVKVGDSFNVYRQGRPIGAIEVIQARDNISACDIKKTSTALNIGDSIR